MASAASTPGPISGPWARAAASAAVGAGLLALIIAFAAIGGPRDAANSVAARAAAALTLLVTAGGPALAYLAGGVGLGAVFTPLTRGSRDGPWLDAALGVALMLSLSHGLGVLGLFGGGSGRWIALAPCAVGLVLLAVRLLKWTDAQRPIGVPLTALLAVPGAALLLVAACQPPGWLWVSEAHGYDALSYHLQLPQEWLALGRVRPVEHNVYSYLPGYVESAFYQLSVVCGWPAGGGSGSRAGGLLFGEGHGVIACQMLHAGMAVLAALLIARATMSAAHRCGLERGAALAGGASAAVFLSTPWVIVTGSLAYNEMGVVALGAAALIAAMDEGMTPARRGVVAGILVGVACGCKPTALTFIGVPVGLVLIGMAPARQWGWMVAAGTIAGLAALAPWLARNWTFGGNPVFPQLTGLFGSAHWGAEQVARYQAAHWFSGSLGERLALTVFPDTRDPAGPVHRGMAHRQWGLFFLMVVAAAPVVLTSKPMRRIGLLLSIGIVLQVALWLFTTHIQSRFLVPVLVPGCVLMGLAACRFFADGTPLARSLGWSHSAAFAAIQIGMAVWVFSAEQRGQPNGALTAGPAALTGEAYRAAFAGADVPARAEFLQGATPQVFVNLGLAPGRALYLLGDAAPLYYSVPLVYATTWDRSILGAVIAAHPPPEGYAAWTGALRARGVTELMVDLGELDRLMRSGFGDPALTPESVVGWLADQTVIVRQFDEQRYLVSLKPGVSLKGQGP